MNFVGTQMRTTAKARCCWGALVYGCVLGPLKMGVVKRGNWGAGGLKVGRDGGKDSISECAESHALQTFIPRNICPSF